MKKALLTIISLLAFAGAFAQQALVPAITPARINENTIVKDSLGNVVPYKLWSALLQSGDYSIRSRYMMKDGKMLTDDPAEHVLARTTPEQKSARLALMAQNKEASAAQLNQRMLAMKPRESIFFTTGESIKPFKVHPMEGKKIDAKDWAGKTVVLNFWFIGCPPCRAEIPDLNKLQAKYANNPNVIFIAIALDQEYDIKDFVKKSPFTYNLVGDGKYYADLFKITSYPTSVVIDKNGKVAFHSTGGWPSNPYWLDKTIQESNKGSM